MNKTIRQFSRKLIKGNIYAQEVEETLFHDLQDLDPRLQKILKETLCINCKKNLDNKINYVVLKDKTMWWHDNCFAPHTIKWKKQSKIQ